MHEPDTGSRSTMDVAVTLPMSSAAPIAVAHKPTLMSLAAATVVLALLLFVCFVLYYFVNWKYLSEVWLLS